MPVNPRSMGHSLKRISVSPTANTYTTAGTLGGDNILTGSLNAGGTWSADLTALSGSGGGGASGSVLSSSGNAVPYYIAAGDIVSGSHMYITDAGAVGIGTQTPSRKLDVQGNLLVDGNTYLSGSAKISQTDVTANPGNNHLWASGTGLYWGGQEVYTNTPGTSEITGAGANTYVSYFTAASNITGTSGLVYSGSKLGIGTDDPAYTLDIRGNTSVSGSLIVVADLLAVQKAIKVDVADSAVLSDSYSHYMIPCPLGDGGDVTLTVTSPPSPAIGDEYFIISEIGDRPEAPSPGDTGTVKIIANTGQTINGVDTAITIDSRISVTFRYTTAHLVCVNTNTWALTISDVGPLA